MGSTAIVKSQKATEILWSFMIYLCAESNPHLENPYIHKERVKHLYIHKEHTVYNVFKNI